MDKNQVTGVVLITLLMLVYFLYFGSKETPQEIVKKEDTTATVHQANPLADDTLVIDTLSNEQNKAKFGELAFAATGESKEIVLENKDIQVTLNSKGGSVKKVLLKNYLTDQKTPLYLIDEKTSHISLIAALNSKDVDLSELYFSPSFVNMDTTGQSVIFKIAISPDKFIEQTYYLPKEGFVMNYDLKFTGLDNIVQNKSVQFLWKANLPKVELDLEQSRIATTVNWYTVKESEFDYLTETSKEEESEKIEEPIKWVSMKQKFFNAGIIAKNSFEKGYVKSDVIETDTTGIKALQADLFIPIGDLKTGKGNFQYYFGPNRYQVLKKVTDGYDKNVYLGWPVINWINRFIVIPTFSFLEGFISNYGIIILILALLVKLILLPLSYKSQISMAKMKVLKPELDEIKVKFPDDLQKQQSEQMALYSKVGINPLSGCIPVLLSMPVLFAMFSFFPNSIELRQQAFLWAPDLSTYDAPIRLPFEIPFYGSHVSVFTLLMTISTLVFTWYNNQMSTVTGPMKSISYMMPVVFMFVLNTFPAGLSFYYFVSNIFSIGQQVLIRRFVDEDKILQTLEENKKKNAAAPGGGKKSKWMQRVEDAMKAKDELKKKK